MFAYLLHAAPSAAPQGSLLSMILPFALIFVVFYFFIIRPNNKKQKETQAMLDAMKKGDKVITIGGIHGTIAQTKEKTVIVKVDDNTKLEFTRNAIATVVTDKPAAPAETEKKGLFGKKAKNSEKVPETTEESAETSADDSAK